MNSSLPRVGVLVPSTDTTLEQELPLLLAGRATVHFTRMFLGAVTPEALSQMEDAARAAVRMLADIEPAVILYGCTSGSFLKGMDHEDKLAAELSTLAGSPVITTARSMQRALLKRGRTVRLRTPYTQFITKAEVEYLEAAGLTVSSAAGLGIEVDREISRITPETLLSHVEGDDADAEMIMISCTNCPTLGTVSAIERSTGLPVVTSNIAGAEGVIAALGGQDVMRRSASSQDSTFVGG